MCRSWLRLTRAPLAWSCALLLAAAGAGRGDEVGDLKAQLEAQQKQIEELKRMMQQSAAKPAPAAGQAAGTSAGTAADPPKIDEKEVQKIVENYLKDNPGAGMPAGVQTGWSPATGFSIRSTPDPAYANWKDDGRIPFELRIRGRIQADYFGYKVTDSRNHLTGVDTHNNTSGDESALLIDRVRLIFEGTAFDPNLRYHVQFDGTTRGLAALGGGGFPGTTGVSSTTVGTPISPAGTVVPGIAGGNNVATVDHAVRLFSAYVAYDWHPCWSYKGCAPDCCDGTYPYQPTVSFIVGKFKPFFAYEEVLGSANQQFVDYAMTEWYFDADDDNLAMGAGVQVKALEDRFYMQAILTNGNDTQIAYQQLDDLPGFNVGFWYDFGGNWNEARKRWDLWGDCISDIDYSCCPVLRVGGAVNLVPMDRRDVFSNAELNRQRTIPSAPGGSTLVGVLNGANFGTLSPAGVSQFAVDAFDESTYEAFVCGKWRGASFLADGFYRNIFNFRGRRFPGAGGNIDSGTYPGNGVDAPILYTNNFNGGSATALFPNTTMTEFGTVLQGGYFLVPKRLELAARWSWIRGNTGNINGDGTFTTVPAAQARALLGLGPTAALPTGGLRVYNGAFRNFAEANEYAIGINYYFRRHLVKWQTDLSWYNGGNDAAGGQSAAGFIPGVDGYMVRTQVQLAF
jgi:hypothetical protein